MKMNLKQQLTVLMEAKQQVSVYCASHNKAIVGIIVGVQQDFLVMERIESKLVKADVIKKKTRAIIPMRSLRYVNIELEVLR